MAEPEPRVRRRTPVARMVAAFGRFWWDFLIGDTPEFAVATGILIGVAYLLLWLARRQPSKS